MGDLWTRFRKPDPSRFYRALPGWFAYAGQPELAVGIFAWRVSGDPDRYARDRNRKTDREYPQPLHDSRRAAATTRSAQRTEPGLPGAAPKRCPSGGAGAVVRTRLPDADGGGRRL